MGSPAGGRERVDEMATAEQVTVDPAGQPAETPPYNRGVAAWLAYYGQPERAAEVAAAAHSIRVHEVERVEWDRDEADWVLVEGATDCIARVGQSVGTVGITDQTLALAWRAMEQVGLAHLAEIEEAQLWAPNGNTMTYGHIEWPLVRCP